MKFLDKLSPSTALVPLNPTPTSEQPDTSARENLYYASWITVIFLIVCGYGAMNHEMWRDEIQAWLLARDSTSFLNLLANMKYEGHPAFWHLCLMPLSRISVSPIMMQVFHLLIAATTVFLFNRYAPFNRLHKFLFSFGYFALYEYGIVVRNYAIGFMLITIFCVLYNQRYRRFIWIGIVLFLTCHTSVHALIVVIAIWCALLCEFLLFYCCKEDVPWKNKHTVWIGFTLIGIGIVTAVLQLNPPPDTGFAVGWNFNFTIQRMNNMVRIITNALLPFTKAVMGHWGNMQLHSYPIFQKYRLLLCYLIIFWCVLRFLKRPTSLFIYLIATIGLLSFFYVKYGGSMRHHGFLFITFVMTSWIYHDAPEFKFPLDIISVYAQRCFSAIFMVFLIFHFMGGMNSLSMDTQYIFSNGKRTAEYIKAENMQDLPMVGITDFAISTVVGYLGKDQIYYPQGSRYGSFVRWDKARTHAVSDAEVIEAAKQISAENSEDVLLILNRNLPAELIEKNSLTLLKQFTGGTIGSEGYRLYLLKNSM